MLHAQQEQNTFTPHTSQNQSVNTFIFKVFNRQRIETNCLQLKLSHVDGGFLYVS